MRQENDIKGIQMGKEEIKMALSADDRVLHTRPARLHWGG